MAVAPVAAKGAADELVKRTQYTQAGYSASQLGMGGNPVVGSATATDTFLRPSLKDFISSFTESDKEAIRLRSREVYSLDADIATLRASSLDAKVRMQRKRNYDRTIKVTWARTWVQSERFHF